MRSGKMELPVVTMIVPCRNEVKFIGGCLNSIIANSYPKDRLEVLVVDGMSQDGTRAIVASYEEKYPFVRLLDNSKKIIPAAVNIGIRHANGAIIMKIDAHSSYPKDYISKSVEFLTKFDADNVGGILKIKPREETTIARAIALVLSHPFGSGSAYVKIGAKEPRWADTASFGCYRKEVFQEIGLWNESLAGSSDMDFNSRLRRNGGKILLVPEIVTDYYADPDLKSFWKHNFADGVWATYVLKFGSSGWSCRHWVPLCFVSGIIACALLWAMLPELGWLFPGVLGAYVVANLGASVNISIRERHPSYILILPMVFISRHIAHGLGALLGLALVLIPGNHWKDRRSWRS